MKAAGKTALESVKEAAVDVAASALAASARSGLEKTKAVIQEKEEKTSAQTQREAARDHKEERVVTAELNKVQRAAKAAHISTTGGLGSLHPNSGSVVNGPGYTVGPPRMSPVPPQATRDPTGGD